MSGKMSISLHQSGQVSHDHNIRNRKITDKEEHIDKNGNFEIWHDEDIREKYDTLFKDAVSDFNGKQKNQDRIIDNYYNHIKKAPQKNVAYEMILQVGNKVLQPTEEQCRSILKEYVDNFQERNPNLIMVGAYFHADEPQGTPHLHLDYVPIEKDCKRGMSIQNTLNGAFRQQGIEQGHFKNLTHAWQEKERDYMESIVKSRNIDIERGITEKGSRHKEQNIFKLEERESQLLDDINTLDDHKVKLDNQIAWLERFKGIDKEQFKNGIAMGEKGKEAIAAAQGVMKQAEREKNAAIAMKQDYERKLRDIKADHDRVLEHNKRIKEVEQIKDNLESEIKKHAKELAKLYLLKNKDPLMRAMYKVIEKHHLTSELPLDQHLDAIKIFNPLKENKDPFSERSSRSTRNDDLER